MGDKQSRNLGVQVDFGINDLKVINKSTRRYLGSVYGVWYRGECFLDGVTTKIWDFRRGVGGLKISHFIMSVDYVRIS